jgi:hypothetical protein
MEWAPRHSPPMTTSDARRTGRATRRRRCGLTKADSQAARPRPRSGRRPTSCRATDGAAGVRARAAVARGSQVRRGAWRGGGHERLVPPTVARNLPAHIQRLGTVLVLALPAAAVLRLPSAARHRERAAGIHRTVPPGYWYYCPSAKGYYPSVPSCPESWVQVAPRTSRAMIADAMPRRRYDLSHTSDQQGSLATFAAAMRGDQSLDLGVDGWARPPDRPAGELGPVLAEATPLPA